MRYPKELPAFQVKRTGTVFEGVPCCLDASSGGCGLIRRQVPYIIHTPEELKPLTQAARDMLAAVAL